MNEVGSAPAPIEVGRGPEKRRRRRRSTMVEFAVVAGMIGFLLYLAAPALRYDEGSHSKRSSQEVRDARELIIGCLGYAGRHDGHLPPSLEALFPEYMGDDARADDLLKDSTGEPRWVYVSGLNVKEDPGRGVVIRSREKIGYFDIVAYLSGSTQAVKGRPIGEGGGFEAKEGGERDDD